jgi:hypothetical protein
MVMSMIDNDLNLHIISAAISSHEERYSVLSHCTNYTNLNISTWHESLFPWVSGASST